MDVLQEFEKEQNKSQDLFIQMKVAQWHICPKSIPLLLFWLGQNRHCFAERLKGLLQYHKQQFNLL